jgi:F-type H+-transporting ATPase subunit epsilon
MANFISLDILTPNGRIDLRQAEAGKPASGAGGPIEIEGVELPGALGELGVLPGHIPFLTPVVPGVVRFRYEGSDRRIAVGQGFAEISPTGVVTILTERALRAWEVEVDKIKPERDRLGEDLRTKASAIDDAETVKARNRHDWLEAQLRAAQAG